MKTTTKIILLSIAASLVGLYLLWSAFLMPDKQQALVCQQVEIEVLDSVDRQFVQTKDIVQLLRKNGLYPQGYEYQDIQTQAIESCVETHPYLKNAECYKTRKGVIHINAEQRLPKFRILGEENYYVDNERQIMPVGTTTACYVPIVTGRVPRQMAQEELYDFVTFLEDNPFWNAQIKQINVGNKRQVELVPAFGNNLIILGDLSGFEAKLDKLQTFYGELNKIGWKDWKEIDLRYKGQIVCRY